MGLHVGKQGCKEEGGRSVDCGVSEDSGWSGKEAGGRLRRASKKALLETETGGEAVIDILRGDSGGDHGL